MSEVHLSQAELEKKLDSHYGVLPAKQVTIIICTLILSAVVVLADTMGVSIALPYIADDLNASKTIQWTGTVFSISNSIFTALCGRFADIFGRKTLLIICFAITGIFQLAEGFATSGPLFYLFRGISGFGAGGIIPLSMIIISDVVEPQQRAKYQGFLGSGIGLGSCLGYFVFSGYIEKSERGWRNGFFTLCPITLAIGAIAWWAIPNTKSKLSKKEIISSLDYTGAFSSSAFLVFILIPLNCGGTLYLWNSALIISFFVLSVTCLIGFILIEKYFAKLPIVPLRLFNSLPVLNLLIQCILYGMAYYSICFYSPYYFTLIRELNAVKTSAMMQCILVPICINSNISGRIISKYNNYNYVIWTGYSLWLLSILLLLVLKESTSFYLLGFILILMGLNIGCTFLPTQQALQSQSSIKDRSVLISLRNVLRYIGNAIGIAISSLIFRTTVHTKINDTTILTESEKEYIINHISAKVDLNKLTNNPIKLKYIKLVYMSAIRNLIYLWIPAIGLCWIMSFFIKDRGLEHREPQSEEINQNTVEIEQIQPMKGKSSGTV